MSKSLAAIWAGPNLEGALPWLPLAWGAWAAFTCDGTGYSLCDPDQPPAGHWSNKRLCRAGEGRLSGACW